MWKHRDLENSSEPIFSEFREQTILGEKRETNTDSFNNFACL